MIAELSEQECLELLETTTVGRVGLVADDRVLIIPVNYLVDGRDVVIRTAPDGILSTLPHSRELIAFEVDHHDDLAGSGWNVLLNGRVTQLSAQELAAVPGVQRKRTWAADDRTLALRVHGEIIGGRRVRRS